MFRLSSYMSTILAIYLLLTCVPSVSFAQPFKAVNLGNWLVVERYMKPSLFDGIPNNDLLDGVRVHFKSTRLQRFLSADLLRRGTPIVANRVSAGLWETFALWRINETYFNLRSFANKKFAGLEAEGTFAVVSPTDSPDTIFQIIRNKGDPYRIRLQASNGKYLQVWSETLVAADNVVSSGWEDDDPSVFEMKMDVKPGYAYGGEYQLVNGYGPYKAPQILQDHRSTYITEDDFRFISENGLDAVKIPVGWWMAYDPTPPKPFVGGSLVALDNAFTWAEKYGLKVIIDVHAIKTSQNGEEHSGSRDGFQEWGESSIEETLAFIDFLSSRYANRPSFLGIVLMNEPRAPGVDMHALLKYYQAGYDTVRKYSQDTYVIFSARLGRDGKELLPFAWRLNRVVIDVHYYVIYSDGFEQMSAEWTIDFVRNDEGSSLHDLSIPNGPLSFVGEWTGDWRVRNATTEEFRNFVKAQQEVFGTATFGWAYWSYKSDMEHWSLKWMIENGYLNIKTEDHVPLRPPQSYQNLLLRGEDGTDE